MLALPAPAPRPVEAQHNPITPTLATFLTGLRLGYVACGRQDKVDGLERDIASMIRIGITYKFVFTR